jgi:hypothetical protein
MTMTTSVRINAPVNPVRLLDQLTIWCGGDPGTIKRKESDCWSTDGGRRLFNLAGQGLSSLCDVEWHPDGPLATRTKYHDNDEESWPDALVECSFDTAYGYGRGTGVGCSDLHHWLLIKLRDWLETEYGIPAKSCWWSAGEFHESPHAVGGWNPMWDLSTQTGNPTKIA